PFAMRSPTPINLPLLESMITKLEEKLPDHLKTDDKKVYLNKHNAYSRITFISPCHIKDMGLSGASITLPFSLANFSACEVSCNAFVLAEMNRSQFFRTFNNKNSSQGIIHRMIFMGQ